MAKFFEYQGKEIFKESGIPIPDGMVVKSPEDARQAAEIKGLFYVAGKMRFENGRGIFIIIKKQFKIY